MQPRRRLIFQLYRLKKHFWYNIAHVKTNYNLHRCNHSAWSTFKLLQCTVLRLAEDKTCTRQKESFTNLLTHTEFSRFNPSLRTPVLARD